MSVRKLSHSELIERQERSSRKPCLPLTVILNNVRSLHNVGSIFRTADGAGVEKIWLCGITGHPPRNQIAKTALGADKKVVWEYRPDVLDVISGLKNAGYQIVLLEQTDQSVFYSTFRPQAPCCLVIGNELKGVSDTILSYSDAAVEIEMSGLKNSLNAAVAFGIVAYHFRNCLTAKQ